MKLKKPDMSRLKELLYAHGEKIALGVCAFIALTFGTLGLLKATSVSRAENSQKTWEQDLRDTQDRILREIGTASINDLPESTKRMLQKDYYRWSELKSDFKQGPYLPISDSGNMTKRINPVPMSIRTGPKDIQIDYIRALALAYDADVRAQRMNVFGNGNIPVGKQKGVPAGPVVLPDPVRVGHAVRMVRVTAAFPMKQQVEEFRKALRYATQKEMFDKNEDLPRILGINVIRYQLNEKGEQIGKEVELIKMNQRSKALDDLLRVAIFDRVQPEVMKKYLYNGLFTPLPMLANAKYPPVNLEGFELEYPVDADEPVVDMKGPKVEVPNQPKIKLPGQKDFRVQPMPQPMQPNMNPQAVERKIDGFPREMVKRADPVLERRLFGEAGSDFNNRNKANDYNVLHALGLFPPQILDQKGGVFQNPNPGGAGDENRYFSAWNIEPPVPGGEGGQPMPNRFQPMPMGGQQGQQFPNWGRDALVSFIDPEVVPGETYSYKIQVRIANPNFQKADGLAFAALATMPELVIGNSHPKWEYTPPITIPFEYDLYAGDQQLIDEWANPGPKKGPASIDPKLRDATAFQIHLWAKKERDFVNNQDHDIADTIIAERILVRRGEPIGVNAYVKFASWNKMKDSLDIPSFKDPNSKDKKNPAIIHGAFLNMVPTVKDQKFPPPVLVDFYGGKRLRPGTNIVEEETAVDALIMTPDGNLFVRNSRVDTDPTTPMGRERQERLNQSRQHFQSLVRRLIGTPAGGAGGGGIVLPGIKN